MESPLPPSHGHHNEEPYNAAGLQNVAEGHEGEQPQEKKSVLGRVKARARKIRDSLTKQGPSNDQDLSHDEENNDEDDKEMVQDPEVPGAPIYDSASVTAPAPPTGVNSGFPAPTPPAGVNSGLPKGYLDTPKVMKEDRPESIISEPTAMEATRVPEDKHMSFSSGVHEPKVVDPIGNVGGRKENFTDPTGNENFTGPIGNVGLEENFTGPIGSVEGRGDNLTNTIGNAEGGGENLGDGIKGSMGMEEDPHSPRKGGFEAFTPSNDQHLDTPKVMEEDRFESIISEPTAVEATRVPEDKHVPFSSGVHAPKVVDPIGNVGGRKENFTGSIGNVGREENFTGPIGNVEGRGDNLTNTIGNAKGGGENLGEGTKGSMGMEEDPHSPRKGGFEAFTPSNDQHLDTPKVMEEDRFESKISEPTAVEATRVPEDKHVPFSSGVHVPKVVDPIGNVGGRKENFTDPTGEENFTGPIGNVEGRGENLTDMIGNAKGGGENLGEGIRGSMGMEEDPHSPRKGGFEAFTHSNDQTKVSDPTGTGEEVETTPILHSFDKMNISNEPQQKPEPEPKQNLNTASHDQFSPEPTPTNTLTNPHEPVPKSFSSTRPENSPLDHLTENPSKPLDRLTENPSDQSSYAQMFTSAAASAKNVVASSFGYGGTEPERHNEMQEGHPDSAKRPNEMQGREEATKPVGGGATDNAQKITSPVTEKLAPVAGAGSTVMSKVRGDDEDKHASDNKSAYDNIEGGGRPDKGVSEKLRPGDEDKEPSEVISGALTNKGKEGGGERGKESHSGVSEVFSDAVNKCAPEDDGEERKPKVTESKAVSERLGTGEEGAGAGGEVAGGGAEEGKGMVGMIKGTVSSWLGRGSTESQTSQGTTYDGNQVTASGEAAHKHGQDDVGGTRPQVSSN